MARLISSALATHTHTCRRTQTRREGKGNRKLESEKRESPVLFDAKMKIRHAEYAEWYIVQLEMFCVALLTQHTTKQQEKL